MLRTVTDSNQDKHEPCELSSDSMLLLSERLKIGCFCVDKEQKSRAIVEIGLSRFLKLTAFNLSDNDSDFLLMCCSLLEGLFCLFTTQHSSGYICPSLLDVINLVLRSTCQVTDHLIPFVLCERRFVTFAATKALIGLIKAECISSGSSRHARQFWKQWEVGLLQVDKTVVNQIYFMEQLFLDFKNFYNGTMLLCPYQKCKFIKVDHCGNEQFNEIQMSNMLHSANFIPTLIKGILSWHDDAVKMHSLHCILRILTMAFEKPSAVKEAFLQDASSLIALLTSQMPSLVWERTCNLLQDILDYQSTTVSEACTSVENKFVLASQFLHLVSGKLWISMPHSDGFHGFCGPFCIGDMKLLSVEFYASADKPVFQSFLLFSLACLATVATHFKHENEDVQPFHEGVTAIQEYIQAKMCSHQESQRAPLNDIQNFCVPVLLLFDEQDDALVQALLYFLDIADCIKKKDLLEKREHSFYCGLWNPHFQFYIFLSIVNKDYEVLLDLLISEETCFLLYFLKYLKLIESDWNFLVESHALGRLCELSLFNREALLLKRPGHLTDSEQSSKFKIYGKETEEVKINKMVDYELSSEDSDAEENYAIPNLRSPGQHHSNDPKGNSFMESVHTRVRPKSTLLEVNLVFNCLLNTIEKQLEKNLFPYNAKPLVRLLNAIKSNYK